MMCRRLMSVEYFMRNLRKTFLWKVGCRSSSPDSTLHSNTTLPPIPFTSAAVRISLKCFGHVNSLPPTLDANQYIARRIKLDPGGLAYDFSDTDAWLTVACPAFPLSANFHVVADVPDARRRLRSSATDDLMPGLGVRATRLVRLPVERLQNELPRRYHCCPCRH